MDNWALKEHDVILSELIRCGNEKLKLSLFWTRVHGYACSFDFAMSGKIGIWARQFDLLKSNLQVVSKATAE